MNWTTKNKLITLAISILTVLGFYYIYINKQVGVNNTDNLKSTEVNQSIQKNFALEDIYRNSRQLPKHNTVCFPNKKFLCSESTCENIEPKVFNLISDSSVSQSQKPTLARCDSNGCDVYDSQFKLSGDHVNAQSLDPKGMIFKMSLIDFKYVEIVTIGLDTHISYGYCLNSSTL